MLKMGKYISSKVLSSSMLYVAAKVYDPKLNVWSLTTSVMHKETDRCALTV